ncbi:hypothetical protein D3C81_1351100 [compost metagenome]
MLGMTLGADSIGRRMLQQQQVFSLLLRIHLFDEPFLQIPGFPIFHHRIIAYCQALVHRNLASILSLRSINLRFRIVAFHIFLHPLHKATANDPVQDPVI